MYAPMRLHMPASGSAVMSNLQELDIMGDLGLLASTHPHASAQHRGPSADSALETEFVLELWDLLLKESA